MKPFQCSSCHTELGLTDGIVLTIGKVTLSDSINIECQCGAHRVWRPVMATNRKEAKQRENWEKRHPLTLDTL